MHCSALVDAPIPLVKPVAEGLCSTRPVAVTAVDPDLELAKEKSVFTALDDDRSGCRGKRLGKRVMGMAAQNDVDPGNGAQIHLVDHGAEVRAAEGETA